MSARRSLALRLSWAAAVLLLLPLAACGGSEEPEKKSEAKPAVDPDTQVRWPRYWATNDQAEQGARGASNARFFIGATKDDIVYNAQDVLRVIDRASGEQKTQTLTGDREVICAVPPRSVIESGTIAVGTGPLGANGESDCSTVRGFDVASGKFTWQWKVKIPGTMTVDTRDDTVLVGQKWQDESNRNSIEYSVTGLDLATGKVRWTQMAEDVFRDDEGDDDLDDCTARPAIAASAPVAIVFATCYQRSLDFDAVDYPRVAGYDLESGERTFLTEADWLEPKDETSGLDSNGTMEPAPNDGSFIPATRYADASYVDAETGKGVKLPTPKVERYEGSDDNSFEAANDFGSLSGSFDDLSVVAAGTTKTPVALYVSKPTDQNKVASIRIEGQDTRTGKSRYVIDLKKKQPKDPYASNGPDFTFLGLNQSRTAFLVSTTDQDVLRYDVLSGKKLGTSLLAPPLGLTKSATFGDGFLAIRTQGGISGGIRDVASGMDYYVTNTE